MKPFLLALLLVSCHAMAQQQKQPNIIFILADDMGYGDLGCYGQQKIKTPQLDQIAQQGMKFTDFYAGSTVCSPSRAALMTGEHTGKTYIRGNAPIYLRPQDTILPQYLQQRGYETAMVGKWGLGLQHTTGVPHKKGWDYFVGHLENKEAHFQHGDSIWYMHNGTTDLLRLNKDIFYNEMFTDSAMAFIARQRHQPFFLYLSFTLPHAELRVPERYLEPYLDAQGKSIFQPETPWKEGQHYRGQPNPKAAYAAMVSSMDDYVGKINALLKQLKIDDNTIVIFTSDNGTHTEGGRTAEDVFDCFQSSGPFRGRKRDMYEGGIRVPFILKWPAAVKAGSISDFQAAFWDILPTFTEVAGGKPVAKSGLSILPSLKGEHQRPHGVLYWEFYEGGFKQAVRFGNWKAIRFYNNNNAPLRTELYDLGTDPGEKNDISTSYPSKVKELEQLMNKEHSKPESNNFHLGI